MTGGSHRERGNKVSDDKAKVSKRQPRKDNSANAEALDGITRSSVEVPVMGMDAKGLYRPKLVQIDQP